MGHAPYSSSIGTRRARPSILFGSALGFALVAGFSVRAHAFEDQWHLGLGAGVSAPGGPYRAATTLSLHGAYGISDVFDARFTANGSLLHLSPDGGGQNSLFLSTLGVAYKLDVIEWVPYCGVRAGYYVFGAAPAGDFARHGGAVGGMCGVDYSFSRSVAAGVEVATDFLLPSGQLYGALLHVEYRWGF